MSRSPAAVPVLVRSGRRADVLLAIAFGIELQVELMFVDAPRGDLLMARGALLAMAGAVALRRVLPVLAAAVTIRRRRGSSAPGPTRSPR